MKRYTSMFCVSIHSINVWHKSEQAKKAEYPSCSVSLPGVKVMFLRHKKFLAKEENVRIAMSLSSSKSDNGKEAKKNSNPTFAFDMFKAGI